MQLFAKIIIAKLQLNNGFNFIQDTLYYGYKRQNIKDLMLAVCIAFFMAQKLKDCNSSPPQLYFLLISEQGSTIYDF